MARQPHRTPPPFGTGELLGGKKNLRQLLKKARQSGIVQLDDQRLDRIPEEVYCLQDAGNLDEDEKWWELRDTHTLTIAGNDIAFVLPDIGALTSLINVNLSRNRLIALPDELCRLPHVKVLNVSHNQLEDLPESIGLMASLVQLNVEGNRLRRLPDSLSSCYDLAELYCQNNNLSVALPLIGSRHLRILNASHNNLTRLADDEAVALWSSSMFDLDVSKNLLTELPQTMFMLEKLIRIDASHNKLSEEVLLQLASCTRLTEVFLAHNCIKTLPGPSLGGMKALRVLNVSNNKIVSIPDELGGAFDSVNIVVLDLSNNDIVTLPHTLGRVESLRTLSVEGNPLRHIRRTLLSGPTSELLAYLRTRLPDNDASNSREGLTEEAHNIYNGGHTSDGGQHSFTRNERRSRLDLSNLGMQDSDTEGPLQMEASTSLAQEIDLARNHLSVPPRGIRRFTDLQVISMDANPLSPSHPGWAVLQMLPHLAELSLCQAGLIEVPRAIEELRRTLRILRLSSNKITQIPEWLVKNSGTELGFHLTQLTLDNNDLSHIDPELGRMETLTVLTVAGNPLRFIRQTIVQQGTQALLGWLRGRIPDGM